MKIEEIKLEINRLNFKVRFLQKRIEALEETNGKDTPREFEGNQLSKDK